MNQKTLEWIGDENGHVEMIDQTRLPGEYLIIKIETPTDMWHAIKQLKVRGAPAIGVAAAYGICLGLKQVEDNTPLNDALKSIAETKDYLATSRPTAVNLFWALNRMHRICQDNFPDTKSLKNRLLAEANLIRQQDADMCRSIGKHGADIIQKNDNILTHCNAGGLATAEYGTALALMFSAHEQGKSFHVYVDETRPLLQGARLTAWELQQAGIKATLICDNMAGHLMSLGKVDRIITGADRIAANGDAANKIGTYSLAVLAKAHNIPFYIAAPSSTFDLSIPSGKEIPIEIRDPKEITSPWDNTIAPEGISAYNPAFDVTPHEYIRAIITETGIIQSPNQASVKNHLATSAT